MRNFNGICRVEKYLQNAPTQEFRKYIRSNERKRTYNKIMFVQKDYHG